MYSRQWTPYNAFLSMFNSDRMASVCLCDVMLRNLSDLELTFQGHSKSNVIVSFDSPYMVYTDIYDSNIASFHCLGFIATQDVFSYMYLLSLGPYYEKSQMHQMTPA